MLYVPFWALAGGLEALTRRGHSPSVQMMLNLGRLCQVLSAWAVPLLLFFGVLCAQACVRTFQRLSGRRRLCVL